MPERLFGNNKKEATVSSKVEGENVECRPYCMAMVMVFPFLLFHAVARNACCKQEEIEGQLCIYLNALTHILAFLWLTNSPRLYILLYQKYSRYFHFHRYEISYFFMLYITNIPNDTHVIYFIMFLDMIHTVPCKVSECCYSIYRDQITFETLS